MDPVPRGYVLGVSGSDPHGRALLAATPQAIVAYPGAGPCPVDDSAVTTIGRAVRIPVLANDAPPPGGAFEPLSVFVDDVAHGSVAVDPMDGWLTYTPEPGFLGTERLRYWVFDTWGVAVRAAATVTVEAGCTVVGVAGVAEIFGSDGDGRDLRARPAGVRHVPHHPCGRG